MALCSCGVTPRGAAYVAENPRVNKSARTILLNARPRRTLPLAFLRASPLGLSLRMRGREGDSKFLFASPPIQRRFHELDRSPVVPRASKVSAESEKPMWWWRTAACLPYFLPLHEIWNYGETAYFLQPHLERFEFLTNPVLEVPTWFSMLYFFVAYLWLVRKKELPHFLRFHLMMGMLLENALQIVWTVSRWMPLMVFGVKVGVYFWTAVSFSLLFCILECMRCALAGKYSGVPYLSDAAHMQIPRS